MGIFYFGGWVMVTAEIWAQQRNLHLSRANRETLIYLLGRIYKEILPPEILTYLAENLPLFRSSDRTSALDLDN